MNGDVNLGSETEEIPSVNLFLKSMLFSFLRRDISIAHTKSHRHPETGCVILREIYHREIDPSE